MRTALAGDEVGCTLVQCHAPRGIRSCLVPIPAGRGRKTLNQQGNGQVLRQEPQGPSLQEVQEVGGHPVAMRGAGSDPPIRPHPPLQRAAEEDALDAKMGFRLLSDTSGDRELGWLMNLGPCSIEDKDSGKVLSAIACYFQQQDGSMFKAKVPFAPYLYIQCKGECEQQIEEYLRRKYEGFVQAAEASGHSRDAPTCPALPPSSRPTPAACARRRSCTWRIWT